MAHLLMIGECMIELSQNNELGEYKQSFAGDVFNTGVYIKRCLQDSAQVSFLSVIGEDKMSTQFLNLMANEQINCRYLYRCKSNKMGLYIINIDQNGERTFDYWRENSAAKQLMKLIKQDSDKMALSSVTTLFFSGISIAILSPDDLQDFWNFIKCRRSQGCQIVFDPNYRPALWSSPKHAKDAFEIAYSLSNVVLPGVDDHKNLYNHESAAEIASHLEAKGIGEIIIKNGDLEVLISVGGRRAKIDITPVTKVVDTTSAGDAFNGGYLSARQSGKSVKDSVSYAASIAGCVIQHKGAIVPKSCFSTAISPLA